MGYGGLRTLGRLGGPAGSGPPFPICCPDLLAGIPRVAHADFPSLPTFRRPSAGTPFCPSAQFPSLLTGGGNGTDGRFPIMFRWRGSNRCRPATQPTNARQFIPAADSERLDSKNLVQLHLNRTFDQLSSRTPPAIVSRERRAALAQPPSSPATSPTTLPNASNFQLSTVNLRRS